MDEYKHDLGEGVEAFQASGLLWALNTMCLHPQGYEARILDGRVVLFGWGERVRQWTPDQAETVDVVWRTFRNTLLTAQKLNNPAYHEGPQGVVMPTLVGGQP